MKSISRIIFVFWRQMLPYLDKKVSAKLLADV